MVPRDAILGVDDHLRRHAGGVVKRAGQHHDDITHTGGVTGLPARAAAGQVAHFNSFSKVPSRWVKRVTPSASDTIMSMSE